MGIGAIVFLSGWQPFCGFKYSDIGRGFGMYGIEAFLERRAILE
jgi:acyl-CoA reductase-like NAD-dependent aldehyde dehydrogenase